MNKKRVLALFSGGLDSILSILWMKRLGYEVVPLFFESYFFRSDKAEKIAASAGLELRIVDIGDKLLEVLQAPRYGFGKNMNPCIDCHTLMFREAGRIMEEEGFDFLISGEVLGQRPMSQRLDSMNAVAKQSGFRDYIIRPLSQKLLPDTIPITKGWVKKEEMLDIQGRSRQRQIELAKELRLEEYSTPGGGCLLTDKGYSLRLKDLLEHDMLIGRFINFLRFGRHFRLSEKSKLIIGRNMQDLTELFKFVDKEIVLRSATSSGPIGIINSRGKLTAEDLKKAAELVLSYTNKAADRDVIEYGHNSNYQSKIEVEKLKREEVERFLIKAQK